eukprot:TRINITY_DN4984_c0_g1_i3.p1 TRINITY_DN4984_c0_g1~~TRINITY_DN4984_c0_g1_i3.p1  ORF type:complete len:172 (+),score=29.32 TRINITY_DN4984_c0_g1_i3:125-640(+)
MAEKKTFDRADANKRELVGLTVSPYTLKALWALRHHEVKFTFSEYLPILGEFKLRVRTGKWSGEVSVPVLLNFDATKEEDKVVFDSFEIAKFTNARAMADDPSGHDLFPAEHLTEIEEWNRKSELVNGKGRVLGLTKALKPENEQVLLDLSPPWSLGTEPRTFCSCITLNV